MSFSHLLVSSAPSTMAATHLPAKRAKHTITITELLDLAGVIQYPTYTQHLIHSGNCALAKQVLEMRQFTCCVGDVCNDDPACEDILFCSVCYEGICKDCFDGETQATNNDPRCPMCRARPMEVELQKHPLTQLALSVAAAKCPGCKGTFTSSRSFDTHVRVCPSLHIQCNRCANKVPVALFKEHAYDQHIGHLMRANSAFVATATIEAPPSPEM